MFRFAYYAMLSILVGAGIGCAPTARVSINQPGFQGLQRTMRLTSRWGIFDTGDSVSRYVMSFPLPGALSGDKHYHLYLRGQGDLDTFAAGQDQPGRKRFIGFFIQIKGAGAGLTEVAGGQMIVKGVAFAGKNKRRIDLEVSFDDGTKISGTIVVARAPFRVERFENEYAGDVQALMSSKAVGVTSRPAQ